MSSSETHRRYGELRGDTGMIRAIIQPDGELHRFLHDDLGSEEALTIALFLYEHGDRSWTADEIRTRLEIETDATAASSSIVTKRIELRLIDLIERGLVHQDATTQSYRFAPLNPRHAELMKELAGNSPADRAAALALIYVRPRKSVGA